MTDEMQAHGNAMGRVQDRSKLNFTVKIIELTKCFQL